MNNEKTVAADGLEVQLADSWVWGQLHKSQRENILEHIRARELALRNEWVDTVQSQNEQLRALRQELEGLYAAWTKIPTFHLVARELGGVLDRHFGAARQEDK